MLTLGWSDGQTFMPIDFSLLSSKMSSIELPIAILSASLITLLQYYPKLPLNSCIFLDLFMLTIY